MNLGNIKFRFIALVLIITTAFSTTTAYTESSLIAPALQEELRGISSFLRFNSAAHSPKVLSELTGDSRLLQKSETVNPTSKSESRTLTENEWSEAEVIEELRTHFSSDWAEEGFTNFWDDFKSSHRKVLNAILFFFSVPENRKKWMQELKKFTNEFEYVQLRYIEAVDKKLFAARQDDVKLRTTAFEHFSKKLIQMSEAYQEKMIDKGMPAHFKGQKSRTYAYVAQYDSDEVTHFYQAKAEFEYEVDVQAVFVNGDWLIGDQVQIIKQLESRSRDLSEGSVMQIIYKTTLVQVLKREKKSAPKPKLEKPKPTAAPAEKIVPKTPPAPPARAVAPRAITGPRIVSHPIESRINFSALPRYSSHEISIPREGRKLGIHLAPIQGQDDELIFVLQIKQKKGNRNAMLVKQKVIPKRIEAYFENADGSLKRSSPTEPYSLGNNRTFHYYDRRTQQAIKITHVSHDTNEFRLRIVIKSQSLQSSATFAYILSDLSGRISTPQHPEKRSELRDVENALTILKASTDSKALRQAIVQLAKLGHPKSEVNEILQNRAGKFDFYKKEYYGEQRKHLDDDIDSVAIFSGPWGAIVTFVVSIFFAAILIYDMKRSPLFAVPEFICFVSFMTAFGIISFNFWKIIRWHFADRIIYSRLLSLEWNEVMERLQQFVEDAYQLNPESTNSLYKDASDRNLDVLYLGYRNLWETYLKSGFSWIFTPLFAIWGSQIAVSGLQAFSNASDVWYWLSGFIIYLGTNLFGLQYKNNLQKYRDAYPNATTTSLKSELRVVKLTQALIGFFLSGLFGFAGCATTSVTQKTSVEPTPQSAAVVQIDEAIQKAINVVDFADSFVNAINTKNRGGAVDFTALIEKAMRVSPEAHKSIYYYRLLDFSDFEQQLAARGVIDHMNEILFPYGLAIVPNYSEGDDPKSETILYEASSIRGIRTLKLGENEKGKEEVISVLLGSKTLVKKNSPLSKVFDSNVAIRFGIIRNQDSGEQEPEFYVISGLNSYRIKMTRRFWSFNQSKFYARYQLEDETGSSTDVLVSINQDILARIYGGEITLLFRNFDLRLNPILSGDFPPRDLRQLLFERSELRQLRLINAVLFSGLLGLAGCEVHQGLTPMNSTVVRLASEQPVSLQIPPTDPVRYLMDQINSPQSDLQSIETIERFAQYQDERIVGALRGFVYHPNPEVRVALFRTLLRTGGLDSINLLDQMLGEEELHDQYLVKLLAYLGQQYPSLSQEYLDAVLNNRPTEEAIRAIGETENSRAILLLAHMAYTDKPEYRDAIYRGVGSVLSRLGEKSLQVLIPLAVDNQSYHAHVVVNILKENVPTVDFAIEHIKNKIAEDKYNTRPKFQEALDLLLQCKKLNIKYPFRFANIGHDHEMLKKLIENRINAKPDGRKLAVVILTRSDWNTAFSNRKVLEALLNQNYRVMYYEASTKNEVIENVLEATDGQKADIMVWGAHANATSMSFGNPDAAYPVPFHGRVALSQFANISVNDLETLKKSGISERLQNGGHVILIACSGGEGREKNSNLANMMRKVFANASRIWSTVLPAPVPTLEFDAKNNLTNVEFRSGNEQTTYIAGVFDLGRELVLDLSISGFVQPLVRSELRQGPAGTLIVSPDDLRMPQALELVRMQNHIRTEIMPHFENLQTFFVDPLSELQIDFRLFLDATGALMKKTPEPDISDKQFTQIVTQVHNIMDDLLVGRIKPESLRLKRDLFEMREFPRYTLDFQKAFRASAEKIRVTLSGLIRGIKNDRLSDDVRSELRNVRDPNPSKNTFFSLKLSALILLAGFLSAGFGISGGALIVPSMVAFFNMDLKKAVATSFAVILPISIIGFIAHLVASPQTLSWPLLYSIPISMGSIVAMHYGISVLKKIQSQTLTRLFIGFLMLIGVRYLSSEGKSEYLQLVAESFQSSYLYFSSLVLLGVVGGMLAALFGIGGGILYVPILNLLYGFSFLQSVAVSFLVIIPNTVLGFVKYRQTGLLDERVRVLTIFGPAVVGAIAGAFVVHSVPEKWTGKSFGVFLTAMSLWLLLRNNHRNQETKTRSELRKNTDEIRTVISQAIEAGQSPRSIHVRDIEFIAEQILAGRWDGIKRDVQEVFAQFGYRMNRDSEKPYWFEMTQKKILELEKEKILKALGELKREIESALSNENNFKGSKFDRPIAKAISHLIDERNVRKIRIQKYMKHSNVTTITNRLELNPTLGKFHKSALDLLSVLKNIERKLELEKIKLRIMRKILLISYEFLKTGNSVSKSSIFTQLRGDFLREDEFEWLLKTNPRFEAKLKELGRESQIRIALRLLEKPAPAIKEIFDALDRLANSGAMNFSLEQIAKEARVSISTISTSLRANQQLLNKLHQLKGDSAQARAYYNKIRQQSRRSIHEKLDKILDEQSREAQPLRKFRSRGSLAKELEISDASLDVFSREDKQIGLKVIQAIYGPHPLLNTVPFTESEQPVLETIVARSAMPEKLDPSLVQSRPPKTRTRVRVRRAPRSVVEPRADRSNGTHAGDEVVVESPGFTDPVPNPRDFRSDEAGMVAFVDQFGANNHHPDGTILSFTSASPAIRKKVVERILKELPAGSKILSIAEGRGHLAHALMDKGFQVKAIDLSPKNAEIARTERGVDQIVGNAHQLPEDLRDFDAVIINEAISSLRLDAALSEASKALKAGGKIIITTYSPDNYGDDPQNTRYILYQLAEIRTALEKVGFSGLRDERIWGVEIEGIKEKLKDDLLLHVLVAAKKRSELRRSSALDSNSSYDSLARSKLFGFIRERVVTRHEETISQSEFDSHQKVQNRAVREVEILMPNLSYQSWSSFYDLALNVRGSKSLVAIVSTGVELDAIREMNERLPKTWRIQAIKLSTNQVTTGTVREIVSRLREQFGAHATLRTLGSDRDRGDIEKLSTIGLIDQFQVFGALEDFLSYFNLDQTLLNVMRDGKELVYAAIMA